MKLPLWPKPARNTWAGCDPLTQVAQLSSAPLLWCKAWGWGSKQPSYYSFLPLLVPLWGLWLICVSSSISEKHLKCWFLKNWSCKIFIFFPQDCLEDWVWVRFLWKHCCRSWCQASQWDWLFQHRHPPGLKCFRSGMQILKENYCPNLPFWAGFGWQSTRQKKVQILSKRLYCKFILQWG